MSYESSAEPIKIGYLMDFKLPDLYPGRCGRTCPIPSSWCSARRWRTASSTGPSRSSTGRWRAAEGSVKAVIDAYGELVDEGCLVVFGPHISDNCIPTREAIEERFKVPALSVTGSDDWLGSGRSRSRRGR